MTTYLLDLWHDLREKRLWPVAVGLVVAIVAIPVVLLKPVSSESAPPVVAGGSSQPATLPAVEVDSGPTHGSKLRTFSSERNPFKPLADLQKDSNSSSSAPTPPAGGGSSGGGSATPAPIGASGGSSGGSTSTGGGSSGSGTPAFTPPSSTQPSGGSSQQTVDTTHLYTHTADVRFGTSDSMKTYTGLKALSVLPDDKTGEIMLMGVNSKGDTAVFFVADPNLTAKGEGDCNNDQDCRFVSLKLASDKNEETFTALDGLTTYHLKLEKLSTVEVKNSAAKDSKPVGVAGGKTIADASERMLPDLLAVSGLLSSTK